MRILHAPINSAGQAFTIARAQRKLGHQSDVWVFYETHLAYQNDRNLHLETKPRFIKEIVMFGAFLSAIFRYDVFHFHCGLSFLPGYLDIPILKFFGKKVLMQYWGSDVIQSDIKGPYTNFSAHDFQKTHPNLDNEQRRAKIKRVFKWADMVIVGAHSLLPYAPKALVVPKAIDLEKFSYVGTSDSSKIPTIVHAPTDKNIKGTKEIMAAIQKLKEDKLSFNFILLEGKSNKEVLTTLKKADIVIDQIRIGDYGTLAVEAMSLGKPVVGRLDQELMVYLDDCPIVSVEVRTLVRELQNLIKKPVLRKTLGQKSRQYVKKHHDAMKIAGDLLKIYQSIPHEKN